MIYTVDSMTIKDPNAPGRAAIAVPLAAAIVFAPVGAARSAAGPDPLPHRAVYDLALKTAAADSQVTGVSGRMALEWADACEGYTTAQRIHIRIDRAEGRPIDNDFTVASWESKDGDTFRFRIRNVVGGALAEEFGGLAERDGVRRTGVVRMKVPVARTISLPAGTVFPSEYASILTREARKGATRVETRVFDGMGEEGLFDVVAFVTGHTPAGEAATGLPELDAEEAWNVRTAYFRVGDRSGLPEYEVGFRLFANGVADRLVLDYGDFVLGSRMAHFEALPDSGC